MLRIFYSSIFLFSFFTNTLFAQQEKIWEIDGNNQRGNTILNLPNNAGYLVASQNQIINFNPVNGQNHWGPLSLQQMTMLAICKADSGHVFVAGAEGNKACIKKFNYGNASVISTKKDTALNSEFSAIYALPNGNAIACGYLYDSFGKTQAMIANVSNSGAFSLDSLPNFIGLNSTATAVCANKQGKIFIAGKFENGGESIFVWEKGSANYKVFASVGQDSKVNFLTLLADGSLVLGYEYTNNFVDYSRTLVKLNASLNVVKNTSSFANINAAIAMPDESIVCTGNSGSQLVIAKLNKELTPIWSKNYGLAPYNAGFAVDTIANGFIVTGETGISDSDVDVIIVRTTTAAPIVKNQIRGQIKGHAICGDVNAIPLSGLPVQGKTLSTGKIHFGLTDAQGFYTLTTDTIGAIEIQAVNIIGSGYQNCATVIDTVLANGVIKTAKTFYVQDTSSTPRLHVDLSTDILVPNEISKYSLYVKNTRTVEVNNAYVKVTFDPALKPVTPITNDSIFVGKLAANEEKTIFIERKFEPTLPIFPNKTYCASATIFPNNSSWDGPRIEVTAECQANSKTIKITVKNNATPSSKSALKNKNGLVIIDDVVMRIINIGNLNSGADTVFYVNLFDNFNTFIVAVDQGEGNPYGNFSSDRGENCNNNNVFLPQTTYSDHDDAKHYSIECLKATTTPFTASKTIVFPLGGVQSISKKDTLTQDNITLEPHLVFVNTGTDTTKSIVIQYKVSENLTLDQIEKGASSHPFTAKVDSNKIIFTLPKIALVPNSKDIRKSIGFLNFRIKIPSGDNESKTFTAETSMRLGYTETSNVIDSIKRTIKKLKISTLALTPVHQNLPSIKIAPTPMLYSAQISGVEHWIGGSLSVFDSQGSLVLQIKISQTIIQLHADDLSHAGLFFCKIEHKGKVVANGKIVVVQ